MRCLDIARLPVAGARFACLFWRNGTSGNCDTCLIRRVIGARKREKILAAVHRTGERYGAAHIVDVLQGIETEKVVASGHNTSPAFGVGAARKREEWQSLIRQLVASGFLNVEIGRYGGLSILEKGRSLLRGDASFHYRPDSHRRVTGRKTRRGEDPGAVTAEQSSLLASLKKLRLGIAKDGKCRRDFSDRTLLDMAKRCPRDIGAFAEVNGVGASKLKDFAEIFLNTIRAHQDNPRDLTVTAEPSA
jgi:ATP-dependent DNA helicase RecQ